MTRFASLVLSLVVLSSAHAQTSYPMITHVHPAAVQRGKATEVEVFGQQNFFGTYKSLFEGTGISTQIQVPEASVKKDAAPAVLRSIKMKVTVDGQAERGVRDFRLASSLGISSIGQIVVTDEAVILEAAQNNTLAQAQKITVPSVIAGKLEVVEDVDFYQFEAKEGDALTFDLVCARIQDRIHDLQKHAKPMLSLHDAEGRELAANDHFFFADPVLSYQVRKTGTYYLQVRESTYDGDPRWVYALLVTNRPHATHVYPMAGNPGQKIDVEPIGTAKLKSPKVSLVAPKTPGVQSIALNVAGSQTPPITFLVNDLKPALEQEPNDVPDQANRFTVPAGLNGRIGKKRDMDHWVFTGKKGQSVRFELKARRFGTLLNSSLHGILEIFNAKGLMVASNDTTHGLEPVLTFAPPADGDFVVRIRDINSKGGDSWVYHVEADRVEPDFTLRCDPDKAMIGPGTSTAWYVHVVRQNGFTGPVKVEVKDLPKDVSASPLTIPASMTQGVIVLTASPSATHQAENVRIEGTATVKSADGKETTLVRRSMPNQEIYSPGGGRSKFDVSLQSVAVTAASDLQRVDVSVKEIVLKPGQEVKFDVTVVRRQDFDKGVFLDMTLSHLGSVFGNPLPPGVTVVPGKSKTLLGTGSQGYVTLKADANAEPVENVPICVLANVSVNFVVKIPYSSPAILLHVRK